MDWAHVESRASENQVFKEFYSSQAVKGYTHDYYKYPARFSPTWVRHAISEYSSPGDLIVDPFMGGGTTLVEGMASGRSVIGMDINELACFIAEVKTTLLSENELDVVEKWFQDLALCENLKGYNFSNHGAGPHLPSNLWGIGRQITLYLNLIKEIQNDHIRNFLKCIVLRTAQWAVDGDKRKVSLDGFRKQLRINKCSMVDGMRELTKAHLCSSNHVQPRIIHGSAKNAGQLVALDRKPKLILTSPPYPGVHVLYHRWQFRSRREFSAPYWITDTKDGHGESFYTLGSRFEKGLQTYFSNLTEIYRSLADLCGSNTLLVQVVAFPKPEWQIERFLDALRDAGFAEEEYPGNAAERPIRVVPNRKWYANSNKKLGSSLEHLFIHRLR